MLLQFLKLGHVESIEVNNKEVKEAKVGQSVCVKIANTTGDAPRMFGRHFDEKDDLYTNVCAVYMETIYAFPPLCAYEVCRLLCLLFLTRDEFWASNCQAGRTHPLHRRLHVTRLHARST